jgi:hypothetical protein
MPKKSPRKFLVGSLTVAGVLYSWNFLHHTIKATNLSKELENIKVKLFISNIKKSYWDVKKDLAKEAYEEGEMSYNEYFRYMTELYKTVVENTGLKQESDLLQEQVDYHNKKAVNPFFRKS